MSIFSQLPLQAITTRPGALQALILQPGQMLEAKVLGTMPNGTSQVQLGQNMLNVVLPTPTAPGTMLQLFVEGAGPQQRLVMVQAQGQGQGQPQAQAGAPPAPLGTSTGPIAANLAPATPPVANAPGPQPVVLSTSPQASTPPPPPVPPPNAPQIALTQMVQAAVQRQDSVGNLVTLLASVVGKVDLPPPVAQAAQQVLAANLPLAGPTPVTGASLQQAVAASGVFQEAMLAQGTPELARSDLKTALLVLRNTLTAWIGQAAAAGATGVPAQALPPPIRGAVPRARPAGVAPVEPATPEEAGKAMLDRTEGSLARLRLHQHASLPDPTPGAKSDWSMDLPVLIGTYRTVMQLQIHREDAAPGHEVSERGWQIRFAMDVPALGEVGAQVGLRGGATAVRLWATDPTTAAMFQNALPDLARSLTAAGLRPGIVIVRPDEPAASPPAAGHFLDAST